MGTSPPGIGTGLLSWTAAWARLIPVVDEDWTDALAAYAERLHAAAGQDHHVVSALGAWLLVALCAPLADDGARPELAEVLGADPMEGAARVAAESLDQPHPLVAAGAGLWVAPEVTTPVMEQWRAGLPPGVTTGDIPTQEAVDAWANDRTQGLIERFPIQIDPDLVCLLATALATKVFLGRPLRGGRRRCPGAELLGRHSQPGPSVSTPGSSSRSVRRRNGPGGHGRRPRHWCPGWSPWWARSSPPTRRSPPVRRAGCRPFHRHLRSEDPPA